MSAAMRLSRLTLLALGASALGGIALPALVAGSPATERADPASVALSLAVLPTARAIPAPNEQRAIALLTRASAAGRERPYSGTQYVSSWSMAGASSLVVDMQHVPGRGVLVRRAGSAASTVIDTTASALDPRALSLLERHYSVSVAARQGQCAGRPAAVVEARRRGAAEVAGRFWLDIASGLLLRRELYDGTGRTVRAAAFVDLQMVVRQPWTTGSATSAPTSAAPSADPTAGGSSLDEAQVEAVRRDGWAVPAVLSGGLELFDVRRSPGVLHLSYTDGLFAVSVFTQRGRLAPASVKGWQQVDVDGVDAWTKPGLTQQMVWATDGWVHTVVADAPDAQVDAAVMAFSALGEESFTHRVQRGLHRMRSWMDPTS